MAATFENIMDRVEHCYTGNPCADCKYDKRDFPHCVGRLLSDVRFFYKLLESRLAQVERERDAAVHDIEPKCDYCAFLDNTYGEAPCPTEEELEVDGFCLGFKWRGVCQENTKEET